MKKVVLIVLTILLLNGCDSSHKYYFVTVDINKGGNLRDGEPWEMKEDNDSLAIEIAKFIHTSRQLTFEKTHTNNKESKIEGAPYSFKLLDHRMNTLYDATHDVIIPNENKVIADIEFGMSQKQVYKLLSKSDRFRDIHRYSDMISFYQEIGNRSYNGTLDFLDDRLYRLSFTSYGGDSYRKALSDVVNIRDVFWEAFGCPMYAYGQIPTGYEPNILYEWYLGNKHITIKVDRKTQKYLGKTYVWYEASANIVDKNKMEWIQKHEEKKQYEKKKKEAEDKQEQIIKDAELF